MRLKLCLCFSKATFGQGCSLYTRFICDTHPRRVLHSARIRDGLSVAYQERQKKRNELMIGKNRSRSENSILTKLAERCWYIYSEILKEIDNRLISFVYC